MEYWKKGNCDSIKDKNMYTNLLRKKYRNKCSIIKNKKEVVT